MLTLCLRCSWGRVYLSWRRSQNRKKKISQALALAFSLTQTHLHHFCSRGTGNARRCPNPRSLRPQTAQSQSCWTTSPSEGASPQPHPQAACLGSSLEKASGCLCGSLSDIVASPWWPFPRFLWKAEPMRRMRSTPVT